MSNKPHPATDQPLPPPSTFAVHATAVAIGETGLLIRGASRSGKSTLALALIAASRPGHTILLVGDDRILLSNVAGEVIAAPHPRILGMIEKRGHGILRSMPYRLSVPLGAIIDLKKDVEQAPSERARFGRCQLAGENFPVLTIVNERRWTAAAGVLEWFAATLAAH